MIQDDPAAVRLQPLLGRLANWERSRPASFPFDLRTMRALLAGIGPVPAPAVQVGGSKGKGTTCAFLDALAQAASVRVGVYTSPHVVTLLERIRIDGRQIAVDELEGLLVRVLDVAAARGVTPTFFEATTAAAVAAFARAGTGLAVYEVGLGGRLDATTAIPVDASILTGVELEHTEILGDTVAAIAAEKAHVVRPGGIGFTAAAGEALAVLERHAAGVGARLAVLGRDFGYRDERREDGAFLAVLRLPGGAEHPVRLPDARGFEPPALALAAAAFAELLPHATLRLDPAPRPVLPCRFETLRCDDGGALVLDGAHTEESLRVVAAELARRWPGRRGSILFGCAHGKRWREGLSWLLPFADRVVVTAPPGTVGEDPATIAAWLRGRGTTSVVENDLDAAWAALLAAPAPRLVTGSFYLAGAVRGRVADRQRQHEDSTDSR